MCSERAHVHRITGPRAYAQGVAESRLVRLLLAAFLVISLVGVAPVAAEAKDSPARKLGRGFGNLTLGVLAIPSEVIDTTRSSGPAVGVTWGLLKGMGMMVATEFVGLWEVLTCPFATPPDYRPILDPEFPWQRFSQDRGRDSERSRKERRGESGTEAGRAARE
jgi:putative exosortase-associated protein (TIGR04073 family)